MRYEEKGGMLLHPRVHAMCSANREQTQQQGMYIVLILITYQDQNTFFLHFAALFFCCLVRTFTYATKTTAASIAAGGSTAASSVGHFLSAWAHRVHTPLRLLMLCFASLADPYI
jgi:hypothetical protein